MIQSLQLEKKEKYNEMCMILNHTNRNICLMRQVDKYSLVYELQHPVTLVLTLVLRRGLQQPPNSCRPGAQKHAAKE